MDQLEFRRLASTGILALDLAVILRLWIPERWDLIGMKMNLLVNLLNDYKLYSLIRR